LAGPAGPEKRVVLRYIYRPPQGKGQAAGGLCLPAGKHRGILTNFLTRVNKKMVFLGKITIFAYCPKPLIGG